MNFLLDTNVISEWIKPKPSPRVIAWLAGVDEDRVFLSVISVAEIRFRIEHLPESVKRRRLEQWLDEDLVARFENRLLGVDMATAMIWGRVAAHSKFLGRPISVMDGFIAATAMRHNLIVATRNAVDFAPHGLELLNPWSEEGRPDL